MTTAGNLLFQGRPDGKLLGYNATSGKILWTFDVGLGIAAPPITYKIDGKQYISLLVGWGGGYAGLGSTKAAELGWAYGAQTRRLITFSLDGAAVMPKLAPPVIPKPIDYPDFVIDESLATTGANDYGLCSSCHGGSLISGGMAPDLRASLIPIDKNLFTDVVRNGSRVAMGMPSHPDISDGQLEALRHYIRKAARASLKEDKNLLNEKYDAN